MLEAFHIPLRQHSRDKNNENRIFNAKKCRYPISYRKYPLNKILTKEHNFELKTFHEKESTATSPTDSYRYTFSESSWAGSQTSSKRRSTVVNPNEPSGHWSSIPLSIEAKQGDFPNESLPN